MTDEIPSIGTWKNNAELLRDVAKLGYITGRVLDATFGKYGAFWNLWRPEHLVTNDLKWPADHAWDCRSMPLATGSFDTVVFDPPYKLRGAPQLTDQDERYGTEELANRDEVMELLRLGAIECFRVTRRWLLVKCQDQTEGGKKRWQTDLVTRAIVDERHGIKVDRFDIPTAGREQPPTRKCSRCKGTGVVLAPTLGGELTCSKCRGAGALKPEQRTSHSGHSTLLVFRKPSTARRGPAPTLL